MTRAQAGNSQTASRRACAITGRRVAAASLSRRGARIYSLLTVFCAFVGRSNLQSAKSSPCEPGFGCFRQQLADGFKVRRRPVIEACRKKEDRYNQRVVRSVIFPKLKNISSTPPAL